MINYFLKTKTEKEDFLKSYPEISKLKNIFLPTFLYLLTPALVGLALLITGIALFASGLSGGGLYFLLIGGVLILICAAGSFVYQKTAKTGLFIHLKDESVEIKKDFQQSKMDDKLKDREKSMTMKITEEEDY